ncbi:MAG: right-handed parallel beta-helix repeat-containing protein [Verrucomicrobiia bacterium]
MNVAAISAAALGMLAGSTAPDPVYVNDAVVEGDRFTQRAGCDRAGDGSAERPFATVRRALAEARPGQRIYLDAGLFSEPAGLELPADGIQLIGAPNRVTRIRGGEGSVLRAEGRRGLALRDLVLEGGRIGVEWVEVQNAVMEQVVTVGAGTYGILLRDCTAVRLVTSATFRSGFRGLQLDRCTGVLVEGHRSAESGNGGIVLRDSHGNIFRACRSERNGMSGFFLSDKVRNNQFWDCVASENKFVGFYLFRDSTGNIFRGCTSTGNERGVTATRSPDNRFERNTIVQNRTFGLLFKEQSPDNQLIRNRLQGNPEGDLATSEDSAPRLSFRNQIGRRVTYSR